MTYKNGGYDETWTCDPRIMSALSIYLNQQLKIIWRNFGVMIKLSTS